MGNIYGDPAVQPISASRYRAAQQPFRIEDWELRRKKCQYNIYKHRRNNRECEVYTIEMTSHEDLSNYELRKQAQFAALPRVIHYQQLTNGTGYPYQPGGRWIRIVLERIPTRLDETKQLPRSAQTVLLQVLEGYQLLHSRFGSLKITPEMIGFGENGAIKVWINSNFAHNEPESNDRHETSENSMVEGIFGLFEPYLKGSCNDRKKYMTFVEAFGYLKNKLNKKFGIGSETYNPQKHSKATMQEPPEQPKGGEHKQTVRPINYILVRNQPKKVHIDLQDPHSNLSGGSHRPVEEVAELRMTNFNSSGNSAKLQTVHHVLTESRGNAGKPTLIGGPRHAINQLAGLAQSQHPSEADGSPHLNPSYLRKQVPANIKMSSSISPTIIRHVQNISTPTPVNLAFKSPVVVTGAPQTSPSRKIIKITTSNSVNTQPVSFSKPTNHMSFETGQEKSKVDRRTAQQFHPPMETNPRHTVYSVASKNSETLRDHINTSNNSGSYKQPLITFSIGKPATSVVVSPQNQTAQTIQFQQTQTASHPEPSTVTINRNINIRPRLRQTRYNTIGNSEVHQEDKSHHEALASKPLVTTMNANERDYKPLNFLKVQERRPAGIRTVDLLRPAPATVLRDGSEPKIYFNYTNPFNLAASREVEPTRVIQAGEIAQGISNVQRIVSRNGSEKQFVQQLPLISKKSTQECNVQTHIDSRTIAVQKDDERSNSTVREEEQQHYRTDKNFEEVIPTAVKIYSQRVKDVSQSTEPKLHSTYKKQTENPQLSGSLRTKHNVVDSPERPTMKPPAMRLEYAEDDNKQPTALNTEIRPNVKVVYSYLNDNPLKLPTHPAHRNTHRISPLPSQQLAQPRLISESDHNIPSPQEELLTEPEEPNVEQEGIPRSIDMNSEEQRLFEEQAYQDNAPYVEEPQEGIPFYQQVCDYYEHVSNEPEVPEQESVASSHKGHPQHSSSNISPFTANGAPQKVSLMELKNEVAAMLYDDHDYQPAPNRFTSSLSYQHDDGRGPGSSTSVNKVRPLHHPYKSSNKTMNDTNQVVNPVGIGFNIAKRQTTSRIKQILAEEKNKREVKQSKSGYDKLLTEKHNASDDLTQYLQRKMEERERQRQQQDRNREEQERRRQAQIDFQQEQLAQQQYMEQPAEFVQSNQPAEQQGGFYSSLPQNVFREDEEHRNMELSNNALLQQHQNYAHELDRYISRNVVEQPVRHQLNIFHGHEEQYSRNYEHHPQKSALGYNLQGNRFGGDEKPISYDDLRADLKTLMKSSTHRPIEANSRRSSKERTIEEKIRQKKSNFAGLKEEAARVLGL